VSAKTALGPHLFQSPRAFISFSPRITGATVSAPPLAAAFEGFAAASLI
jgi:hypothetical protein